MRVLFINHTARLGGAEQSLLELVRALPAQGVTPEAAVPAGPLADRLEEAAVVVHRLPLHAPRRPRGPVGVVRTGWGLAMDLYRLCRLFRRVRPDVVHANGAKAAWVAIPAARWLRIPCVWHCRDLAPVGARRLLRWASRTVAISEAVRQSLPSSPRVVVVPNGIDLVRFDPARVGRSEARAVLGVPPDAPLVLMVADLIPWKRHDLFLAAAANIHRARPDAVFAVAGGDRGEHPRLAEELRGLAARLGLDGCVRWLGSCEDTAPLFAAADVLLHPPDREPFGRVVCEALAMNCPVVVAAAAGPAETAADCAAARRVPPGDADAFAAAALDLLSGSPVPRGRPHIAAHYDVARVASALTQLYSELGVWRQDKT